MKLFIVFILSIGVFSNIFGQNLLEERIRKITSRKKSIFLDKGIFHNGTSNVNSKLIRVRHFYSIKKGYERVVFDFSTKKVPRVYGHVSKVDRKIYVDFFNTEIAGNIGSFGNSKYISGINFFPLSKDSLSIELSLKQSPRVDVFYLESPGKLVVDIKI